MCDSGSHGQCGKVLADGCRQGRTKYILVPTFRFTLLTTAHATGPRARRGRRRRRAPAGPRHPHQPPRSTAPLYPCRWQPCLQQVLCTMLARWWSHNPTIHYVNIYVVPTHAQTRLKTHHTARAPTAALWLRPLHGDTAFKSDPRVRASRCCNRDGLAIIQVGARI